MASVSAFNQTLGEFLDELIATFPEDSGIKKQKTYFEIGIKANNRIALDAIMPDIAKHADSITKRDESALVHVQSSFPDINFVKLWESGISDNTKNAIWDYINTLLMLGTTIMTIPSNMLSEIEKIAQTCVSQMQENQEKPDDVFLNAQKAILNNGMLQNMAGQFPNLQMPQGPQQQSQTPRKNPDKANKTRKGKKK